MKTINYIVVSTLVIFLLCFNGKAFAQCTVAFTTCHDTIVLYDCDHTFEESINWPQVIANQTGFCTNFTLTRVAGPAPGSSTPLGQYLIRFLAEAIDINTGIYSSAICDFFVQVKADNQPPVFNFCPPNITIHGVDDGTGNCTAKGYWIKPTSTDNCSNTTLSPGNFPCGHDFPMGTTTVSYTSSDASGNVSTCSFTVTVLCTTPTEEHEQQLSIVRIHPNPTKDYCIVELSQPAVNGQWLRVIDSHGQIIKEEISETGSLQQTVEVRNIPEGLYFLQIVSNSRIISISKFVKM